MSEPYHIQFPSVISAGVYLFTSESGVNYEVRFGRKKDNILHATVVFGVINDEFDGEEYTLTNRGELYRVMSTVILIIKKYMQEHPKINTYEFTGISKEGEGTHKEPVRAKLYKRYIEKILPEGWSYKMEDNKITVSGIR